jgi:hypothetical protein
MSPLADPALPLAMRFASPPLDEQLAVPPDMGYDPRTQTSVRPPSAESYCHMSSTGHEWAGGGDDDMRKDE